MLNRSKDGIIFNTVCNFINDQPVGYIFTFDEFKKQTLSIFSYSLAASYFDDFKIIGVIEQIEIDNCKFKIISHIPEKFNYAIMSDMLFQIFWKNNWKIWFMTFEDRLNSM
jgi:hypothetical protein